MLEYSEACERNKEPILDVLREALRHSTRVLEIGSGTGQHAVYFARHLDHLVWCPSDRAVVLPALRARIDQESPANTDVPRPLDAIATTWPNAVTGGGFDAVFTANTLHIMAWSEVEALFGKLGGVLSIGGVLCVYGPFRYGGAFTSASNQRFDRSLRSRDPASGIRDFEAVDRLAREQGLTVSVDHAMPANNQLVVWQRSADPCSLLPSKP